MPEVTCGYLVGHLFKVGPTLPGAYGAVPLTHSEIRAYQDNEGIELQPWEVDGLRRLSGDFLVEAESAKSPERSAPWAPSVEEFRREILPNRIKSLLRG